MRCDNSTLIRSQYFARQIFQVPSHSTAWTCSKLRCSIFFQHTWVKTMSQWVPSKNWIIRLVDPHQFYMVVHGVSYKYLGFFHPRQTHLNIRPFPTSLDLDSWGSAWLNTGLTRFRDPTKISDVRCTPWEPQTFMFRGYKTSKYFWGVKPSFFMVFWGPRALVGAFFTNPSEKILKKKSNLILKTPRFRVNINKYLSCHDPVTENSRLEHNNPITLDIQKSPSHTWWGFLCVKGNPLKPSKRRFFGVHSHRSSRGVWLDLYRDPVKDWSLEDDNFL